MNTPLKVLLIGFAVLALAIAAFGVWLFASGRAQKMASVMNEVRIAATRPGAAEVRAVPGCILATVFDTKGYWESSPALQQRFPALSELPPTLVICGVRKHVTPPSTTSVAEAYARAFSEPQSIVVLVERRRLGEKHFDAQVFDAASP